MMNLKQLAAEHVLAAAVKLTEDHAERYPNGGTCEFSNSDLTYALVSQSVLTGDAYYCNKPAAQAAVRKHVASLLANDHLSTSGYRGNSQMYKVTTDEMRRAAMQALNERNQATHLAMLLGGEAEHMRNGSHVSLTLDQALTLVTKLGAMQDRLDRAEAAYEMAQAALTEARS